MRIDPKDSLARLGPRRKSAGARSVSAPLADAESAFLDTLLSPHLADLARGLAHTDGVSPVQAACATGLLDPEQLADRLAETCRVRRADTANLTPAPDARWEMALETGLMPVLCADGRRALLATAEPARTARLLAVKDLRNAHDALLLTTRETFDVFVADRFRERWIGDILAALEQEVPKASASSLILNRAAAAGLFLVCAGLAAGVLAPAPFGLIAQTLVLAAMTPYVALRLTASLTPLSAAPSVGLTEAELPVYSVLVPLFREAAVAQQLIEALCTLDYPRAKLDILIVLEEDDHITRAALRRVELPPFIRTITMPALGPRTKPKALAAALPFTRGSLVTVYDAEDRPDPRQLREAAGAFARGGPRLGCLQAPLTITNHREGLIPALFAADYAGLFSVILPGLALSGAPLPLGGTSNHVRRVALRGCGGWDPFNVTEDADLGLRLARHGWRIGTLWRPTQEDAVTTPSAWLKQRQRWFKGWMQTLGVLAREPLTVMRQVGGRGTLALLTLLLGNVLSALLHPVCLALAVVQTSLPGTNQSGLLPAALLLGGYGSALLVAIIGLRRQGQQPSLALLALPLHWLGLSLAAWLAVLELWRRPFHWNKTAHAPRRSGATPQNML